MNRVSEPSEQVVERLRCITRRCGTGVAGLEEQKLLSIGQTRRQRRRREQGRFGRESWDNLPDWAASSEPRSGTDTRLGKYREAGGDGDARRIWSTAQERWLPTPERIEKGKDSKGQREMGFGRNWNRIWVLGHWWERKILSDFQRAITIHAKISEG